ncbi:MAG: hypothetical protein M0Z65_08110 [Firmicutes bacterium]|uniref:Uncharacterized protein n=1 Tax=Melghirimyces thermohalophilus TaxID=1236220 RepID=A0A1G6Q6M3_9BACL|nr:hypothetical protein [Melghirimyces thermohalophilus]MDA8353134.1 hypothetical protein [Bacillota bacterium]SDC88122.1 hypothetical protein SAMN04488112_12013 [Melghirimyces thermohalophilus]
MRSTGKGRGRFYEHYQVEDVLTFFSGQLVSAKSPDGMQVLLQEIALKDSLPPGSKELLTHLENEHLAPVLDVIEEQDRIVLVHPPLTGEPLSLMIHPRQGMEPAQALSVYRQLLRTAVRLAKLPIPLFTTLDPRNIIMEGSRPFVLFVSFEKFSKTPADEKWRFLLHFLLTGFQLERRPENPESDRSIQELPQSMKELVLLSMDPNQSMERVLEVAEKTVPPPAKNRPTKKKGRTMKRILYSTVVVVVLIAGAIAGNELFLNNRNAAAEVEDQAEKRLDQEGILSFSDVSFEREKMKTQSLPPSVQDSIHVTGELSQSDNQPFVLSLASEEVESDFGIRVDQKGQVHVFQYVNGETYDVVQTESNFTVQPDRRYKVDIFHFPGKPFRVAITEKESSKKWVAVGQVPMNSVYKIQLKGKEGTQFANPKVSKLEPNSDTLSKWMEWQPWLLVSGDGVLHRNQFHVDSEARIRVKKDKSSFVFKRKKGFDEDPLRLEMESVDGDRYYFTWSKEGRLELNRLGYENKKLGDAYIGTNYTPEEESRITIQNTSKGLSIQVEQGSQQSEIQTRPAKPITFRNYTIITQSELSLINK